MLRHRTAGFLYRVCRVGPVCGTRNGGCVSSCGRVPLGRQPPALHTCVPPPLCSPNTLAAEVELHQGKTQPPDYLTEAELIGLMEKHGIGTGGLGGERAAPLLLLCAGVPVQAEPGNACHLPWHVLPHSYLLLALTHLTARPWPPSPPLPPDASIPVHINNICERNYVGIQSGRRCVPTELGITLIR